MMILMAMVVGSTGAFAASSMFDGMNDEQLANYEIQIVDKTTGKVVGKMSRAEYKVVRIDSASAYELPEHIVLTAKQLGQVIKENREVIKKYNNGYNTVILHAGTGKAGLMNETNGSNHEVSEKETFVAGATGCRSIQNKGLCASAFTNKTFMFGLKLDF